MSENVDQPEFAVESNEHGQILLRVPNRRWGDGPCCLLSISAETARRLVAELNELLISSDG